MKKQMITAVKWTVVLMFLSMGVYALILMGHNKLSPGLGFDDVIGFNDESIYDKRGQEFSEDKYFWSRPFGVDYNTDGNAGSNKDPNNPERLKIIRLRIDIFLAHNPSVKKSEIPVDMVTAGLSCIDSYISVQGAMIQVPRIGGIRGLPEGELYQLVQSHIEMPLMGLFGPERVYVPKLNIALDKLDKKLSN